MTVDFPKDGDFPKQIGSFITPATRRLDGFKKTNHKTKKQNQSKQTKTNKNKTQEKNKE